MSIERIKKIKNSDNWITQTEAARLRKVSPAAIALLLRRGRLRSKVINGRKMVFYEDVITFKPAPGRPSKNVMQAAIASVNRQEWLTQTEAAKLRKLSMGAIKGAIEKGRLRILKSKDVIFVRKEDVLNYRPRIDFRPESPSQSILPPGASPEDWITVAEAARIRGVDQSTITAQATRDRIRSIKKGRTRLVYREDVVNFKSKKAPGQQPKKRVLR
ncbi:MAG: hypothetical protein C5B47_02180 [Verrucomicrobia bacterium]|nr:MAG: hypothetical protein C5B47_02180 [Verrucomicrobiota bacterium]